MKRALSGGWGAPDRAPGRTCNWPWPHRQALISFGGSGSKSRVSPWAVVPARPSIGAVGNGVAVHGRGCSIGPPKRQARSGRRQPRKIVRNRGLNDYLLHSILDDLRDRFRTSRLTSTTSTRGPPTPCRSSSVCPDTAVSVTAMRPQAEQGRGCPAADGWSRSGAANARESDSLGWQGGYAAFSASPADVPGIECYVREQAAHHRNGTFDPPASAPAPQVSQERHPANLDPVSQHLHHRIHNTASARRAQRKGGTGT